MQITSVIAGKGEKGVPVLIITASLFKSLSLCEKKHVKR